MPGQPMGDKERLEDALSSEKWITGNYNTFANECVSNQLRNVFLDTLRETQEIHADVYNEMSSRGWYTPKEAPPNEINATWQKFEGVFSYT